MSPVFVDSSAWDRLDPLGTVCLRCNHHCSKCLCVLRLDSPVNEGDLARAGEVARAIWFGCMGPPAEWGEYRG